MTDTPTYSDKITLDQPVKRGDKTVEQLQVRTPSSGELRGLSLVDLGNLDVDTLHKLLPRITKPSITEEEARKLCPADLLQTATLVTGFLLPKSARLDTVPST